MKLFIFFLITLFPITSFCSKKCSGDKVSYSIRNAQIIATGKVSTKVDKENIKITYNITLNRIIHGKSPQKITFKDDINKGKFAPELFRPKENKQYLLFIYHWGDQYAFVAQCGTPALPLASPNTVLIDGKTVDLKEIQKKIKNK